MNIESLTQSPVGMHMLDALVADGFAGARPLSDLSEGALYEVVALAARAVAAAKWSSHPAPAVPWDARAAADAVARLATTVPRIAAARWWSDGTADRPQIWIAGPADVPRAGVLPSAVRGKPPVEIWTSSAVESAPSAWWPVLRVGADSAPPEGPQSIWCLTPDPAARVYDIDTRADWKWLCETFPGPPVDGWVVPAWSLVATEFDAVHLTVAGLISTQGAAIETAAGDAMLDDWDAESTAWLRWVFVTAVRLGAIEPDGAHSSDRITRGRASLRARPPS